MLGTQTWLASAPPRLLSALAVATVLKHLVQIESQVPSAFFLCGNGLEKRNAMYSN